MVRPLSDKEKKAKCKRIDYSWIYKYEELCDDLIDSDEMD